MPLRRRCDRDGQGLASAQGAAHFQQGARGADLDVARQGGFGVVAREPLVNHDAALRTGNPARQLVAGGQVVFDHGNAGHGRGAE